MRVVKCERFFWLRLRYLCEVFLLDVRDFGCQRFLVNVFFFRFLYVKVIRCVIVVVMGGYHVCGRVFGCAFLAV